MPISRDNGARDDRQHDCHAGQALDMSMAERERTLGCLPANQKTMPSGIAQFAEFTTA
jgi:hypothetical protein